VEEAVSALEDLHETMKQTDCAVDLGGHAACLVDDMGHWRR